jgi:hypothetical protein
MAINIKKVMCSGKPITTEQHSVELFNNFITQNSLDKDNILGLTGDDTKTPNMSDDYIYTVNKNLTDIIICYYESLNTTKNDVFSEKNIRYIFDIPQRSQIPDKKKLADEDPTEYAKRAKKNLEEYLSEPDPYERAKKDLDHAILTQDAYEISKPTLKMFEEFIRGQMLPIKNEISTYSLNFTSQVIKYFSRTLTKNKSNQNSLFGNIVDDKNNKFSKNKPSLFDIFNLSLYKEIINAKLDGFPVKGKMTLDELLLLAILNDPNCRKCLKSKENIIELENCILDAINRQSQADTYDRTRLDIYIKDDDNSAEKQICCDGPLKNGLYKYLLGGEDDALPPQPSTSLEERGSFEPEHTILTPEKSNLALSSKIKAPNEIYKEQKTSAVKLKRGTQHFVMPIEPYGKLPKGKRKGELEPYNTKLNKLFNNDEITKIFIICTQSFITTFNDAIQEVTWLLFGKASFLTSSNIKCLINVDKKYILIKCSFVFTLFEAAFVGKLSTIKTATEPKTYKDDPISFEIGLDLNNNTYELIQLQFPDFIKEKIRTNNEMITDKTYFDINKQIQDIQEEQKNKGGLSDKMIEKISSVLVTQVTQKVNEAPIVFTFNKDQVEKILECPLRTYLRYTVRFETDAYGNKKCTFIIPTGGQFKLISEKMKKQSINDPELKERVIRLISEIEKERSYCSGINSAISTNLRSGFSNLSKKFPWGGRRKTRKLNNHKLKSRKTKRHRKKTNRRLQKKQRKTHRRR